ncbi:hypothetical protein [Halalkalibacter alkaliphilus]|uniref:Uncharacterized protein n=1 Tax=Halalkalibacter alkaliphilus TaxID=2917993 RepID=A0A9X2CSK8_9BACI|nr:hypothetical protein [Halalkalibacter alkaliphilus]MCL7747436.1 hypothetical protein [Halalkalibacter alkaliphilus]
MIQFDNINKQILSSACLQCEDEFFQPPSNNIPKVGCCSYSPTFYLLEIAKMINKDEAFFQNCILQHPKAHISPFHITVQAQVHPDYTHIANKESLSKLAADDLRHSYSVCQFFKYEKGCSLDPSFKNSVCRSFICLSIEAHLNKKEKESLQSWTHLIKHEESLFQRTHEESLKKLGVNLQSNPSAVVHYFKTLQN